MSIDAAPLTVYQPVGKGNSHVIHADDDEVVYLIHGW
jgi:hypothetical protein